MRSGSLALLVAALLTPVSQARADEPAPVAPPAGAPETVPAPTPPPVELPPAPPPPAAAEVLAGPGICGTTGCAKAFWLTLEVQGHLSFLTPALDGPVSLDFGAADQITWDPIEYDVSGGGRAEVLFPLGSWIVNLGATFWGTWQDTALTNGRLAVGSPPSPSPPLTDVGLTAEATLWTADLAFLKTRCVSPCFFTGWGLGLKAVSFQEEGDVAVPPPTVGPVGIVSMEADDCLIAAQVVGQLQWKLGARWDLRLRGAAFAGWLHKETEVTTRDFAGIGTQARQTDEEDTVGYGGEVEISVGWCVARGWTLRAGYGLLALGNVTRLDESSDWSTVLASSVIAADQGDDLLLAHRFFLGLSIDL